jgi:hypothetical protein
MKLRILSNCEYIFCFLLLAICGCTKEPGTEGIVYSGKANLNTQIREFTAVSEENEKSISLTMTGPHELTFTFDDKITHIDYEEDVIIFRSEPDKAEWAAKKVKGGFQLEDGTLLRYGNCRGWNICLLDSANKAPLLKGEYSLAGNSTKITLWISEGEEHVELLGLMANGLLNRSRDAKQVIEASVETVSPQVWTY